MRKSIDLSCLIEALEEVDLSGRISKYDASCIYNFWDFFIGQDEEAYRHVIFFDKKDSAKANSEARLVNALSNLANLLFSNCKKPLQAYLATAYAENREDMPNSADLIDETKTLFIQLLKKQDVCIQTAVQQTVTASGGKLWLKRELNKRTQRDTPNGADEQKPKRQRPNPVASAAPPSSSEQARSLLAAQTWLLGRGQQPIFCIQQTQLTSWFIISIFSFNETGNLKITADYYADHSSYRFYFFDHQLRKEHWDHSQANIELLETDPEHGTAYAAKPISYQNQDDIQRFALTFLSAVRTQFGASPSSDETTRRNILTWPEITHLLLFLTQLPTAILQQSANGDSISSNPAP